MVNPVKLTPEIRAKMSASAKARVDRMRGSSHANWKGASASYRAIHAWMANNFGKPQSCEHCDTTDGAFDWANISGAYMRDRADWKRLCRSCHRNMDHYRHVKHVLEFNGKNRSLKQWSIETGIPYLTIYTRHVIKKWPPERVLRMQVV
jgi:hypothetical protein